MKTCVSVTDRDWQGFMRAQMGLEEVNFRQPSTGGGFRALSLGQPFLFKLRYPNNAIVGGRLFVTCSRDPDA